ncbi:DNA-binding protein [Actinoplanes subglobosus]|uniref:DNA-binding protein n=1 Tax=Actinoplanes subglobosus TaxID=1547892 RepID=A0ABV8J5V1_9ACTN
MSTVTGLDRNSIRLVGAHEIRLRFGNISRQRVYQLTSRTDFPTPIANLAQGKVWLADEVEAWRAHRRAALAAE